MTSDLDARNPAESVSRADIVVTGAGTAGLVAAIALAQAGFAVVCVGPADTKPNGRTVALFEGSLRFLRRLGLWDRLASAAQPIKAIRMIDDTRPFLPVPPLTFEAKEIGLDALGANIENDKLVARLTEIASTVPGLTLHRARVSRVSFSDDRVCVVDETGASVHAPLVVAADGRQSIARSGAGIVGRSWLYPQVAMTTLLAHRRPHGGVSTEFHTRGGPCTLVPLRGDADQPHRSSLVWLMTPAEAERRGALDDAALALELQRQTRSLVGRIALGAERGVFPMGGLRVNRLVHHRIALIGEAAHAFPPLAAQGLNLSLRDIGQLLETVERARAGGADIGSLAALRGYERARRRDITMRTSGVDVLNRSIMTDFAPVDAVRGAGAIALRLFGPVRRALLREGILPSQASH